MVAKTTSAPRTVRRRRTADQTRLVLLEAGVQLTLQALDAQGADGGSPLAHIRVQDVVRAASEEQGLPLTTGALYNIWPTQKAYQVDLMFHLLKEAAYPSAEPTLRLAGELFAQRLPFEEVGARLADESFQIEVDSPIPRVAHLFSAISGNPAVHEAIRTSRESEVDASIPLYTLLLNYGGLRIKEPYTIRQLAIALSALSGGLQHAYNAVPDYFKTPKAAPSIVAVATHGVFTAFCEPVPAASRRTKS